METREHRDGGAVGVYVKNDPRPYRVTLKFAAIERSGYVRSWYARLVRPGYPGDSGQVRVVVKEVVEGFVHGGEDANYVAWSIRLGWHVCLER